MFLLYLGIYIFFLLIVWGFFGVARIHAYKFKNFSNHIVFATRFLLFWLLFLSIAGAYLVYLLASSEYIISIPNIENTDTFSSETSY